MIMDMRHLNHQFTSIPRRFYDHSFSVIFIFCVMFTVSFLCGVLRFIVIIGSITSNQMSKIRRNLRKLFTISNFLFESSKVIVNLHKYS